MDRIIVCLKQVPETQDVRLDPETHTLKREGVKAIINPFDLYAVEEALRLKEAHGGAPWTVMKNVPFASCGGTRLTLSGVVPAFSESALLTNSLAT
mgnify:CR=1 FL=1